MKSTVARAVFTVRLKSLAKNPNERAQLAAWRQGGATVGLLLCTVGFMPIQALFISQPSLGYLVAALVFVTGGLFCMWWCYSGVKERYVELTPDHHKPSRVRAGGRTAPEWA